MNSFICILYLCCRASPEINWGFLLSMYVQQREKKLYFSVIKCIQNKNTEKKEKNPPESHGSVLPVFVSKQPFESSVTVLFYLCCFFMTAVHQLLSALVSIALEVGGICLERDCYRSTSIVSADIGNKEMLDFTVLFPLFFSERKVVREPIIQATHLQRTIQFPGFCNKCQSRKTLTENCLMWFCTEEKVQACSCIIHAMGLSSHLETEGQKLSPKIFIDKILQPSL